MQNFHSDIGCFPCYGGRYRRSLRPDPAARSCENFWAVFSDSPVRGIAPPARSQEEGIAWEVFWIPKPCVPHASACEEALKSLGDWCLLPFPTGTGLGWSSRRCKRGAPALGTSCPKGAWGASAPVGLVGFFCSNLGLVEEQMKMGMWKLSC